MFLPDLFAQPFFLSSNMLHLTGKKKGMNEQSVQTKKNIRKKQYSQYYQHTVSMYTSRYYWALENDIWNISKGLENQFR